MTRWICGVGLALTIGSVAASESTAAPVKFWANARVSIDQHGTPQRVEPSVKLGEVVRTLVEQRVLRWRFEPAVVEGQAKAGVTYVFLAGCAVPSSDGTFDVAMAFTGHGPGPVDGELIRRPPAYPPNAARAGNEGRFRVTMRVGTDGKATLESVDAIEGNARPFREALRAWVGSRLYVPEEVDGMPVSTSISSEVDFWLPPPGRRGERPTRRLAKVSSRRL